MAATPGAAPSGVGLPPAGASGAGRAPAAVPSSPGLARVPAAAAPGLARARPGSEPAIPRPGAPSAAAGGGRGSEPAIVRPGASAPQKPPGLGRRKPEGDPFIGLLLNGRFKIESKLGEGGFGAVYRGTQVQSGRKVALKLLHPEMTRDENLVARFRREGLVLCNLQDPHTITTYDFDQTPEGMLYIAMELLEGKSLHTVFHNEAPIEWRRVLKILSQMCSSLGEAHRQGIVHRDLKPENIYLENRGGDPEFVKILDFGIAKVMRGDNSVDPQAPQLTATGQTLGTLEYMSPEQLMGKQLDGRSDVYALGVLGYELLTGRLPFPEAKGPAALITAQLKQTPKPPSSVNAQASIPIGVDRIIGKTLEKDKNARFADVGALAAAAQECLATGRWGDPPGTVPTPLPVANPILPSNEAMRPTPPAPPAGEWSPVADALPTHPPDLHGRPTAPSDRAQRVQQQRPGPTPYPPTPHLGHGGGGHGGAAPGGLAVVPVGASQGGMNPAGMNPQGMNAPGMNPAMNPQGMSAPGMNAGLAQYPPHGHNPPHGHPGQPQHGNPGQPQHGNPGLAMSSGSNPGLSYGYPPAQAPKKTFVWIVLALIAVGAGVGVTLALLL